MKLQINHEFKSLISPLTPDEYQGLELSIIKEGCRDAIVVWNGTIIDGHNRYEICTKHGIDFKTTEMAFSDDTDAKLWIIQNQFNRRNLTPYSRAELALRMKAMIAEKAKERQAIGHLNAPQYKNGKAESPVCQNSDKLENPIDTKIELAKAAKVSHDTIYKVEYIQKHAPEEIKEQAKAGDVSINQAYIMTKKLKNKEMIENWNSSFNNIPAVSKPIIYKADAMEFMASQDPVDLLLTDPVYSSEFKSLDDFQGFVQRWLRLSLTKVKDTGRAYIFIGAYPKELSIYLNTYYALNPQHLTLENILVWTYRNTLGPSPKDIYKLNWQAILYCKGKDAPPLNCPVLLEQFTVQDISAPGNSLEARYHAWQKPDILAERLIMHSTKQGDTVLDPFAGTGTFVLAATKLGRIPIACELSDQMLDIAKTRGCEVGQF